MARLARSFAYLLLLELSLSLSELTTLSAAIAFNEPRALQSHTKLGPMIC